MKPIIVTVKKTTCDHVVTYVCLDIEQAVDWANNYIQDHAKDVGFGGVNWAAKMFRLTSAPSPTGPYWFTKCGPLTIQINQNPLMGFRFNHETYNQCKSGQ